MKSGIGAKLRSRAGESIGETLVALLISSLALLMLAGAVSSAKNVVTTSKQAMTEYYEAGAKLAAHTKNDGDNYSSGSITITLNGVNYTGTYYENARLGATPVIAYNVTGLAGGDDAS